MGNKTGSRFPIDRRLKHAWTLPNMDNASTLYRPVFGIGGIGKDVVLGRSASNMGTMKVYKGDSLARCVYRYHGPL